MLSRFVPYCFIIIAILFISCDTDTSDANYTPDKNSAKSKKESFVKVNRYLVNTENKEISNYIRRHKLTVVETGSGLSYQITKHGEGQKAQKGKIATLDYKIKLITGDVIYSSNESGPKEFGATHVRVGSAIFGKRGI